MYILIIVSVSCTYIKLLLLPCSYMKLINMLVVYSGSQSGLLATGR